MVLIRGLAPSRGGPAGLPLACSTIFFGFSCAAAGTAVAVAAAATAAPPLRNLRRLVVLTDDSPIEVNLTAAPASTGAVLMPLGSPLGFPVFAQGDGP